jgi:hypothetical protein
MADKATGKTIAVGDMVTIEVAVPHCGLEKGYRKEMKATPDLLECLEKGLWKVVKK